ncbi:glycosyltransferase family 87 protein [Streptomyces sp. NRRL F-5755]|uniref:glycosyltransferase family 87 protein n=1 Tax=Streptomyces sp. NRRL F-5755 TaxID=1519475 RepID=UPI0006AFD2A7|nr:glycosyltransferase family 87 protein [Streptomyces sp. NRRL F-5755]
MRTFHTFLSPWLSSVRQPPAGVHWRWDRLLLAVCAVAALVVGLLSPADTSQQAWGLSSAVGYGCAAWAAWKSPTAWSRTPALIAAVGSLVVPLLYLTAIGKAQMEVGVVQQAAERLFSSGTPYHPDPHAVKDFTPYLPGMALFGIPRLLFGDVFFASARLWFLVGFFASVVGALRVLDDRRRTGLFWLAACPVVALPLAIGGVDPPVIGLICLALAFAHRGDAGCAGLVLGMAAALKWTAWPAVPVVIALLAARQGKRAGLRCGAAATGLAVLATLPAVLVDPAAFFQNALAYPLGLSATASTAQSPLLGHLIVALVPHGKAVTVALIALSAAAVAATLLLRPPRSAVAAADRLALGLALAIALCPATRIGYAIYPVLLLAWPRLTLATSRPQDKPTPDRRILAVGLWPSRRKAELRSPA